MGIMGRCGCTAKLFKETKCAYESGEGKMESLEDLKSLTPLVNDNNSPNLLDSLASVKKLRLSSRQEVLGSPA